MRYREQWIARSGDIVRRPDLRLCFQLRFLQQRVSATGHGILLNSSSNHAHSIENCNFVKNSGWASTGTGAGGMRAAL